MRMSFPMSLHTRHAEQELFMSDHHNFKDESGLFAIVMGLIVLVSMSALPATIGWLKVING